MGAQGEGEGEERGNCKREEQDFIHAPLNAKQKRDAEESDSFFAPSLFAAAAEKTVTAAALNLGFCSLFSLGNSYDIQLHWRNSRVGNFPCTVT